MEESNPDDYIPDDEDWVDKNDFLKQDIKMSEETKRYERELLKEIEEKAKDKA